MILHVKLAQWKQRLLWLCSRPSRERDVLRDKFRAVEDVAADLRERLKLAIAAQESATSQLIAERALRQAADERADRYHGELTDSLKSAANWSAKALNRKSMFSEVDAPEEATEAKPIEPIRPKPFARSVAQQHTHSELMKMLDEMRNVGPEFSTQ